MEYLNLHRSVLDGAEFISATPAARSTWLCLLSYCCGQENGGVIEACQLWSDSTWQQVARVKKRDVFNGGGLWRWNGEHLEVSFYPLKSEKSVRAKRNGGAIGNARRWGSESLSESLSESHTDSLSDGEATRHAIPVKKGKEMEGNEKEGKATEIPDELTVLKFGAEWGGDMARAIPAGIPEGWLLAWYAWRCSPAAGPFPGDWQADLTRRFRSAFLSGDRRARKNGEKTGAVSASVAAVADSQRRAAARAELRELTQELDALQLAGAEIPSEKTARERELRRELSE